MQDRSILHKQNKETKAEKFELVFWAYVCIHIHRTYVRSLIVCICILQGGHAYAYMPRNPNPEKQSRKM